jgi:hypothetical protein
MSPLQQLAEYHPSKAWCGTGVGEVPVGPAISGAAGLVIGGIAGLTIGAIATVIVMHISEQEHKKTRRHQRAGYAY